MKTLKVIFSRWYNLMCLFLLSLRTFFAWCTLLFACDIFTIRMNFYFKRGNKGNVYTRVRNDCSFCKNYLFNNKNQKEEYT